MVFNQTLDEIADSFSVKRRTISNWIENETLKYGKHYVDIRCPNSKLAKLRFNLDACQKVFLTPPEKR